MISTLRSTAACLAATTATAAAGAPPVIQATSSNSSSGGGSSPVLTFLLGVVAGYFLRQATATSPAKKDTDGVDSKGKEDIQSEKEPTAGKPSAEGILIVEGDDDAATAAATLDDSGKAFSIRMVVQRFRQAQLTVYQGAEDKEGSPRRAQQCGLLVYISFSNTATESMLYNAALTLVNLPVMTLGRWGDGTKPCSILEAAVRAKKAKKEEAAGSAKSKETADEEDKDEGVAIMIVPQANLISKVKRNGKSIQYHGQIGPLKGAPLYQAFVRMVQLLVLECEFQQDDADKEGEIAKVVAATLARVRGKTKSLQGEPKLSSSWDDAGFPLGGGEESAPRLPDPSSSFVSLIFGTFGKTQALELQSDMGPFCHVVNL